MRPAYVILFSICLVWSASACGDDGGGGNGGDAAAGADSSTPVADGGGNTGADGGGNTGADGGGNTGADGGGNNTGADGGNGNAGEVMCGQELCTAAEECCVSGMGPMQTATCVAEGTCQDSVVECDGPEDCTNGDVCCGTIGPQESGTSCQPSNMCQLVLCHEVNDCEPDEMCCDTGFGGSICSAFCF